MGRPAFEPQRVLAGRYRLEERLGGGGMGAIWRAEHIALQSPVAVKLIDRDAVHDEQTVARFLREAKAAAALRSHHVVHIIDYGMDDNVPFIVMELLEGETLAQRLKRVRRLTATDTTRFISHVGRAISRAHEAGIVHRDLKPENVFIVRNEDEEIAKVLDFGVAKIEHGALAVEGEKTRTGSILGTPYYMSPEQAQGNKAVDYRSDLWSLGVMAFECLTGKRPFYSDGLGDLVLQICVRELPVPSEVAAVPIGFDAWFARAVERDPDKRFQSAREMTEALRDALCIETRELRQSSPEILVSTHDESSPRSAPAPSAPTTTRDPRSVSGASSRREAATLDEELPPKSSTRADPIAATIAVSPALSSSSAAREVFADRASVPNAGSGLGSVVGVAAIALALGLGGGVWALQHFGIKTRATPLPSRDDDVSAPPSAEHQARKPATHRETSSEPSAQASATPTARSNAVASAAASSSASAALRERHDAAPEVSARPAASVDAGWVKPAWAIPDPEPKRVDEISDTPPDR